MKPIRLKRVYEKPEAADGYRILVDRLWPRGLSKKKAKIDLWCKEAAPSRDLRRWFDHETDRWEEFRRRYFAELDAHEGALDEIVERVRTGRVTLVFASREARYNNATALKEYLEQAE